MNDCSSRGAPLHAEARFCSACGSLSSEYDLFSSASWERRQASTRQNLLAVAFANSACGIAAGDNGTIVTTSDGGQSWVRRRSGVSGGLYGLACAGERAWAVGRNGTILASADSGATWRRQPSHTGAWLSDADFLDSRSGLAVGADGTVLRTDDGGKTWTRGASGTDVWLCAVDLVDEENGWAVGEDGIVLATVDGGATWSSETSGTEVNLCGVSFSDAERGCAVGREGTLLAAYDGGVTWTELPVSSGRPDLWGVQLRGGGSGLIVGDAGAVFKVAL